MAADTEGRLYICTEIGIQVFDPQGRLVFIMAAPPGGNLWHIAIGGPDFQTLYASAGYKLFRRPLKTKGILRSQS
jgi:sugar lactone lactonase YvrE